MELWTQGDACEKTLTVAISAGPKDTWPHTNPAHMVVDKCYKAWWRASLLLLNHTCEDDCGWVVDWQGLGHTVPPSLEPEPEPVGTVSCASFDDLQERLNDIERECCDRPDDDCGTGFPATCDAHCATVLIPTQIACAKYLSSQKLLATAKASIDAAAAMCPAAPECSDYNALEQLMNGLHQECCDGPNQDCGSGLPSTCNAACAAVLLPMQAACAEYMSSTPLLAGAKESLDAVAALCP